MRDCKYSLEIMKREVENKYISPEIKYAFENSIQVLEKQIPKSRTLVRGRYLCCSCETESKSGYCNNCSQRLY